MHFKDHENGREHNLQKVVGTDFWYSNHEELFIVDEQTGYCYQTTALHALESILRRKNMKSDLCCVCQEQPHREASAASKVIDKYFKKGA